MRNYLPAVIVLLSGCVSPIFGERFTASIQPGMTTAQVKAVLGDPDSNEQRGGFELYRYSDKEISAWGRGKATYEVLFKDGKVIKYGMDGARSKAWGPGQNNRQVVLGRS